MSSCCFRAYRDVTIVKIYCVKHWVGRLETLIIDFEVAQSASRSSILAAGVDARCD